MVPESKDVPNIVPCYQCHVRGGGGACCNGIGDVQLDGIPERIFGRIILSMRSSGSENAWYVLHTIPGLEIVRL